MVLAEAPMVDPGLVIVLLTLLALAGVAGIALVVVLIVFGRRWILRRREARRRP